MSIKAFFKRIPSASKVTNVSNVPTVTNVIKPNFYEKRLQTQPKQQIQVPERDPNLRSFDEIPLKYRQIFQSYQSFNSIQSKVFDDVFYSDSHIIVSAPTGSGKTVIFELAIVQLIENLKDPDFTIIYLAPIKALCTEKYNDWSKKFTPLGISVREVTGDSDISDLDTILSNQIILSTPEKWDSLTRRWKENLDLIKKIKLFLIDEIHLLNDEKRGPVLEAVVSRMKTIYNSQKLEQNLRFIAVSATIPNIEDLAVWIGGDRVKFFKISDELRPVKLTKIVLGYNCAPSTKSFKFDINLNYKLESVVKKYSEGKPSLIFCNSRKGVEMALNALSGKQFSSNTNRSILQELSEKLIEPKLKKSISNGIAYHHAGLSPSDRNLIEDSFRQSLIPILLSTSTLAMGVNLPAHLVIIKSTQCYNQGAVTEYDESTILQMIGRAGRPQFDQTGTAVIMTQQENVRRYEKMVSGTAPIESHLHKGMVEHLNSEIVLETISNVPIALDWIKSTFLYVRAIKNPKYYNITERENVEKKLEEIIRIEIDSLEKYGLLTKSEGSGEISSTAYGKLMAKYYLSFETMKRFTGIKGDESLSQIYDFLTTCYEFTEFPIRTSDKSVLNELNRCKTKETIRFPIKGKIQTVLSKVSCLMQSTLGNLPINDVSLLQESQKMCKLAEKLTKCLSEYIRLSESRLENGVFRGALNSTILIKCFQTRLWENSPFVSRQLKKIGAAYSGYLVQAGKNSFDSILETLPRELERILQKNPPFGNEIIAAVSKLPKYELKLSIERGSGRIEVFQVNENFDSSVIFDKLAVVIGDSGNNLMYFNDNVHKLLAENNNKFERWFKVINPNATTISGHLIHLGLVGVDQTVKLPLNSDFIEETQEPIVSKVAPKVVPKVGSKVAKKVKKPKVPVKPIVVPNTTVPSTTLITDFYDLTNEEPEQQDLTQVFHEQFDLTQSVATTDQAINDPELPEELTQVFDSFGPTDPVPTQTIDEREPPEELTQVFDEQFAPTDPVPIQRIIEPELPEELTQVFVPNAKTKRICFKRKTVHTEVISPKKKIEEDFPQIVDEPQFCDPPPRKSSIFFKKSDFSSNLDFGCEDFINEPNDPTPTQIISSTPSLMEMSFKLRQKNQSEKIETVLKSICDPNTYNRSFNLKNFHEVVQNEIEEEEELCLTLTGEVMKENDFLSSQIPEIVRTPRIESPKIVDRPKLSSFFNENPKKFERREVHPATPSFNEIFRSNDVRDEISRKRKIVPIQKNFNVKIPRVQPDSTDLIFQNLTKKINQRIIDRRVDEVNKRSTSKRFVTIPGSIELVADRMRREVSFGKVRPEFRCERERPERGAKNTESCDFFNSQRSETRESRDFFDF